MASVIRVELGSGSESGTHSFSSLEEIIQWGEKERQYWRWVSQHNNGLFDKIHSQIVNILGAAKSAKENPDESEGKIKSLQTMFKQIVNLQFEKLPRRIHLERLRGEDVQVAIGALGYWYNKGLDLNMGQPRTLIGVVHAILFDLGYEKNHEVSSAYSDSLNAIIRDFQKKQGEFVTDLKQQKDELDDLLDHARQNSKEQRRSFDAVLAEQKKELEAIKEAYNTGLGAKAPAAYWSEKKTSHNWWAIGFGGCFLLVLVGGTYMVFQALKDVKATNYTEYLPLMVIAFAVLWVCRLLARLMLSNIHLATDAAERTVMTEAYLAMLKEGRAIADNDRQALIMALFRPTSSGVIKDDGAPPHTLEWLFNKIAK